MDDKNRPGAQPHLLLNKNPRQNFYFGIKQNDQVFKVIWQNIENGQPQLNLKMWHKKVGRR